jgi:hypothetical protein
MQIRKGQRWLCFFYIECTDFDVLGGVWKESHGHSWTLEYALRGIEPDTETRWPGKSVYTSQIPDVYDSEEDALARIREILKELCALFPTESEPNILPVLGNHHEALRIIQGHEMKFGKKIPLRYFN